MTTVSPVSILQAEDRLSASEVAAICKVERTCIFRWRSKGRLLSDGTRIFLSAVTVGRRTYITRSGLNEFLQAIADDETGRAGRALDRKSHRKEVPASKAKRTKAAKAKLDAAWARKSKKGAKA